MTVHAPELAAKLAELDTARESEAFEFAARGDQAAEAKAEAKRLGDLVPELTTSRDDAERRADKSEGLVERRSNEVRYLKRRIEALTSDAGRVDSLDEEIKVLDRDNTLMRRRVNELENELAAQSARAAASAKAVDVLAERSSERDEFAAKVAELEQALDRPAGTVTPGRPLEPPSAASEMQRLTTGSATWVARRSEDWSAETRAQVEVSGDAADEREADLAGADEAEGDHTQIQPEVVESSEPTGEVPIVVVESEVVESSEPTGEVPVAESEVESFESTGEATEVVADESDSEVSEAPFVRLARVPTATDNDEVAESADDWPEIPDADEVAESADDWPETPDVDEDATAADELLDTEAEPEAIDVASSDEQDGQAISLGPDAEEPEVISLARSDAQETPSDPQFGLGDPASAVTPAPAAELFAGRKRAILPAALVPNTGPAVDFLLTQRGVTAIVDARSSCAQTGIRPSDLFDR